MDRAMEMQEREARVARRETEDERFWRHTPLLPADSPPTVADRIERRLEEVWIPEDMALYTEALEYIRTLEGNDAD